MRRGDKADREDWRHQRLDRIFDAYGGVENAGRMTDQVAKHEDTEHEIDGHEFVTYFSSIVMLYK